MDHLSAAQIAELRRQLDEEREQLRVRQASEEDLVNSGLQETMAVAYNQIRGIWKQNEKVTSLRSAAFVNAIDKVALCYGELGVFP